MTAQDSSPVPPDAVRVWRGFRSPALSTGEFHNELGATFLPATVKMQSNAGLCSYIPTVVAGLPGKPDSAPDETAILFWGSQTAYRNSFNRLAVRIYTLTHNGVYAIQNHQSRADFPVLFKSRLVVDQPSYLFEKPADWMRGAVNHLVAARPAATEPSTFQAAVANALADIQKQDRLDGAIACVGADYLVYWELEPVTPSLTQPPSGLPLMQSVLTDWSQVFAPAATSLPIGLWDEWEGMDVQAGSSFNMQFDRKPNP